MESKRQQKFARIIQKELSDIFHKEGISFHEGSIVTITTVRATPDLSMARVYLSIFNSSNKEAALSNIKAQSKEIRYKLGTQIKNQVRIVPNLEFFIDDSIEYASHMDQLFEKINKSKEGE